MRIAIHQANFVPWFPYFYKMAAADKFVILNQVQFEKNGFQNRFQYKGKWITKPVKSGLQRISEKDYVGYETKFGPYAQINEGSMVKINMLWIEAIRQTLDINTEIVTDYIHSGNVEYSDPTDRLVSLIKWFNGKSYITNPEAKEKYLNEDKLKSSGIDVEYCVVPKHLRISIFEAFEIYGIEGLKKQLPKKEQLCLVQ